MYTEQQFRNKITIYSFLAIIAVVFIHTYNLEVYHISEDSVGLTRFVFYFESVAASLWTAAVPMFFMISGFLMFRNFTWDKLWSKYQTRFFTVLIPYLLWNTIYYLYYILVTRVPFIQRMMNGNEVVEISLREWLSRLWTNEYFVFWFLKDLIILIILTPVIYFFLRNSGKWPVGFVMLILSVYIGRHVPYWPFNICYLLGAYIGINHKSAPLVKKRILTIIGCGGVIAWIVLNILQVLHICTWQLPIWMVLCCLWFAGDCVDCYEKQTKWWMSISFFIYCMHDMILEAYEKIFLKVFGTGAVFALTDYFLMPLLTVITLIAIAMFMRKYMSPVWKILTGNRG